MNYDSQFMWFLYPALFFLLLYLLLPHRVRGVALIVALLGLNTAQGQNLHTYGQEVRKGNEAFENGKWEEAAAAYNAASAQQPDAFVPKFNTGTALMKGGDAEGAAQALVEAAQSTEDPLQQSDALYNLGNLLMDAGQFQEAAGAYIESLKRQPNRPDAVYNLNRALEQQQDQQEQQQDQQQDQEQEQEKEEEQEKSDNPNEQPQDEQEDQDNSKKDQDQQGDGDNGEQDPSQQPQEDEQGEEGEQNKPKEGGETTAKMTPEEIKGLLEAIQRAEEKTAEKMNAKKAKGKKKSGEKDW